MRGKAIFQIVLFIISIFSVYSPEARAEEQQVCCELTKSGEFCSYTTADKCSANSKNAATSCEQTSFCKLGCAYYDSEGTFFKNTPRATCEGKEGCAWFDSPTCDIPQAQLGCCMLSGEASYVTEARCKIEASRHENVQMVFDSSVESEQACINQARSSEKGACVQEDGTCSFATRAECNAQELKAEENATKINPNVGFHKDMLCSNPLLGTVCAKQQYTGCLPDQDGVYWFDSCGNQENIYSSNKGASYNQGYILPKEKSCSLKGAADPDCGNCDYTANNLCGTADRNEKPKFGNFVCKDLNCQDITKEDTSPASSTAKRNGESWCAFDSKVGFGQDLVGSRHFRRLCINGQELTEPCKDFREEICVQGVQAQSPLTLGESTKLTGAQTNYIEAACRENRWQSCSKAVTKKSCDNNAFRDCIWVGSGIDVAHGGSCIPFVPPGLKFWPEDSDKRKVPAAEAGEQCLKGNQECTVVYEKGGIGGSWKCIANCECKEQKWLEAANEMCISLGDCGAYYNYIGDFTKGGAKDDHPGKLSVGSVQSYNALVNPKDGGGEYNGFGTFFKKSAIPLTLFAAQGIAATIMGLPGGLTTGFELGLAPIKSLGEKTMTEVLSKSIGKYAYESATRELLAKASADKIAAEAAKRTAETAVKVAQATTDTTAKALAEKTAAKLTAEATQAEATAAASEAVAGQATAQAATEGIVDFITGTLIPFVNLLMLIWTIYNLLDVLLADTMEETVSFTCQPWTAPIGGDKCEECGKDGKPCSEYRCKSLGQLCKLINEGTSKELCVNTNPNDASSPQIKALKEVIVPDVGIQEAPNQGYMLTAKIKPFTPVVLGIQTNEPSQCKFALNTSTKYDEMPAFFGDSLYDYNHTMTFSLPNELAEPEVLKLTNGGNYQLFIKCQDQSGNTNQKDYYIKFGVQPGPDLTPPSIELTSIANPSPISAGTNETMLTIYANEPAECKWSKNDIDYTQMENAFACNTRSFGPRSVYYGLYDCTTILKDIKVNQANNYYFRCKDQPSKEASKRNTNIESYKFTLFGTIPLKITSVKPSGELFTKNPTLQITTSAGAEQGKAICGFSTAGIEQTIDFVTTGGTLHEQPLNLASGSYTYNLFCIDKAGNQANSTTTFAVSVDTNGPALSRVYKSGTILHLETSEDSTCEYSTKGDFSFGKGTLMTGEKTREHEATLDASVYFVKCKDVFENEASYKIYP